MGLLKRLHLINVFWYGVQYPWGPHTTNNIYIDFVYLCEFTWGIIHFLAFWIGLVFSFHSSSKGKDYRLVFYLSSKDHSWRIRYNKRILLQFFSLIFYFSLSSLARNRNQIQDHYQANPDTQLKFHQVRSYWQLVNSWSPKNRCPRLQTSYFSMIPSA